MIWPCFGGENSPFPHHTVSMPIRLKTLQSHVSTGFQTSLVREPGTRNECKFGTSKAPVEYVPTECCQDLENGPLKILNLLRGLRESWPWALGRGRGKRRLQCRFCRKSMPESGVKNMLLLFYISFYLTAIGFPLTYTQYTCIGLIRYYASVRVVEHAIAAFFGTRDSLSKL